MSPHNTDIEQSINMYLQQGDNLNAIQLSKSLCQAEPDNEKGWLYLAMAYYQSNELVNALEYCRKALNIAPDSVDANFNYAVILYATGQYLETIKYCKSILKSQPSHAATLGLVGIAFSLVGQLEEAEKYLNKSVRVKPLDANNYCHLGQVQLVSGKAQDAVNSYLKARQSLGDRADIITGLADAYERQGKYDKAYNLIEPLFNADKNDVNIAICFSKICKYHNRFDDAIIRLKELCNQEKLKQDDLRSIHFMLGKLYDYTEDFENAFKHYELGNKLKNAEFSSSDNTRTINVLIQTFTTDFINSLPKNKKGNKKDVRPVFIVGMPRSGTSLVEQILASHPEVSPYGELPDILNIVNQLIEQSNSSMPYPVSLSKISGEQLNQLSNAYLKTISSSGDKKIRLATDKTPMNYYHLGLIEALFPRARVINCVRNPADICLSCYFQDFYSHQPFSYNLKHLAEVYKNYEKLMQHWKRTLSIPVYDMDYEKLVNDPDNEIHSLIDFVGLKWNDRCMDFHKSKRIVATASYDQVRKPMYTSSVNRWENYKEYIGDLLEVLPAD